METPLTSAEKQDLLDVVDIMEFEHRRRRSWWYRANAAITTYGAVLLVFSVASGYLLLHAGHAVAVLPVAFVFLVSGWVIDRAVTLRRVQRVIDQAHDRAYHTVRADVATMPTLD